MSEATGIAGVLAGHLFTLYPGEIACDCEWTAQDDDSRAGEGRMIASHCAHLAAAVLDHLRAVAADEAVRLSVARQVYSNTIGDPAKGEPIVREDRRTEDVIRDADRALAAFLAALGGGAR